MSWFSRGNVSLKLNERIIFLHPSSSQNGSVAGKVVIELPKATEIKGVAVRLLGTAHVKTRYKESTGTTIDLSRALLEAPTTLPAGTHVFDFHFSIPARTAVHFRLTFNRGSIKTAVSATVDGLGFRGAALTTAEELLSFVPVLVEPGEPAAGLELYVEDAPEDLGPLSLSIRSPQFTVASLFLVSFLLPVPSVDLTILDASLILREIITTRHYGADSEPERQDPIEMRLFRLDASHPPTEGGSTNEPNVLARVKAGSSWKVEHFARLPDGHKMRYSTPRQTVTPLRVDYEFCFELHFRIGGDDRIRQMTIERPVLVASCLVLFDNLVPPDYSAHFDDATELSADEQPRALSQRSTLETLLAREQCICRLTYDECLADWHSQMSLNQGGQEEETRESYKAID